MGAQDEGASPVPLYPLSALTHDSGAFHVKCMSTCHVEVSVYQESALGTPTAVALALARVFVRSIPRYLVDATTSCVCRPSLKCRDIMPLMLSTAAERATAMGES